MLKIGNKEFKVKKLNASFPIEFYKKTGKDIFALADLTDDNKIEMYEILLYLSYHLVEFDGSFEAFCDEVSFVDVFASVSDIMAVFNAANNTDVKSKSSKK